MLLAILKFNYNVNYVKRKEHTSIPRGKIDVWLTLLCFWKGGVDVWGQAGGKIPKCSDGLDSETIHLYNVNKKKFDFFKVLS